jgi:hypothetical protein
MGTEHAGYVSMGTVESLLVMNRQHGSMMDADRRQRFFEELNAAFATLQADPEAWAEELAERAMWDATLADGLSDD